MVKLIHTSDFHLGITVKGLRGYAAEEVRREDIRGNMSNIFAYAARHNVDAILITGDIFHRSSPHPKDFNLFNESLVEMEKRGIYTIFISGNHDRRVTPEEKVYMDIFKSRGKPYSIFVSHIPDNPIILEIGGEKLGIAPIPYISHRKYRALTGRSDYGAFLRKEINRLLSEMHDVDFKVLMAHLLVRGCRFTDTYVERYSEEPQIPVDYLYPEEFDYIALGHAHLNQRIRDNAHYAGSIERIDFSEIDDEKYFNLVDLSDGDVERINLLCRKMYSFDLSLQPQVDILALFKDRLSKLNGIKGAIIRLKVYGNRHSLKKFDKLLPRIDKVMLDDYGVAAYSYVKEPLFLGRRPRIDAERLTPIRLKDVARTFISNRYRDRGKIVLNRAYSLLDEVLGEEDEADRP